MGLRCIFGHDFGETTTEKDREERGDEVVVTITEVRECARCGEREVVSENTEVTTLDPTPDASGSTGNDAAGRNAGSADPNAGGSPGRGTNGPRAGGSTASESGRRNAPGTGSPGEAAGDDGTPDATRAPDSDVDVVVGEEDDEPDVEDDAEIIDDGPSESSAGSADAAGRDPRAWPDSEETHPADADGGDAGATAGDWPDHDGQDRGFDAGGAEPGAPETGAGDDGGYDPTAGYDAGEGGGVTVSEATPDPTEAGTVPEEDVEFVGDGPEPAAADTNGTEPVVEADGVAPEVDLTAPERETNREYFCPDCGHAETVGASSMRKGDICPECLRGYIDERPVE